MADCQERATRHLDRCFRLLDVYSDRYVARGALVRQTLIPSEEKDRVTRHGRSTRSRRKHSSSFSRVTDPRSRHGGGIRNTSIRRCVFDLSLLLSRRRIRRPRSFNPLHRFADLAPRPPTRPKIAPFGARRLLARSPLSPCFFRCPAAPSRTGNTLSKDNYNKSGLHNTRRTWIEKKLRACVIRSCGFTLVRIRVRPRIHT